MRPLSSLPWLTKFKQYQRHQKNGYFTIVISECDYRVTRRECIETVRVISKIIQILIQLVYNNNKNIINLNKISFTPFPKLFLAMNRIHRKILKIRSRLFYRDYRRKQSSEGKLIIIIVNNSGKLWSINNSSAILIIFYIIDSCAYNKATSLNKIWNSYSFLAFVQMMVLLFLSSQKDLYCVAGNMYPYPALNSKKL